MVATPCYGGQVTVPYLKSMLKLQSACQERGVALTFQEFSGIPLVTFVRNELVARFLDIPDATHLLFVDADIGFEPQQMFRLLEFGAEVAAAAYPRRAIDWRKVEATVKSGRPPETAGLHYVVAWSNAGPISVRNGFARVRYIGAGFLMIRRHVLTRLCEAHPELRYKRGEAGAGRGNPDCFGLFETMIIPETGAHLSEDAAFCKRWADLGGEIWVDTQSKLTHTGSIDLSGDLATQFDRHPPSPDPGAANS
jgi:hypothetical protein